MDSKHIEALIAEYLNAFRVANPGMTEPEIHFDNGCFNINFTGEDGKNLREKVAQHELLSMMANLRTKRPIVYVPIDAEQPGFDDIEGPPSVDENQPPPKRKRAPPSFGRRVEPAPETSNKREVPPLTLSRRGIIPREERWKRRLRSWVRNK